MGAPVSGIVEMHPHNPDWAAEYESLAAQIKPIIGDQLVLIEHVGSTAIPGIKAKPIIDILVVVNDLGSVAGMIPQMEALEYDHSGERGIPGRQYFRREPDSTGGVHVHIYQKGHKAISKKLNFRDYLRTHPERAQAYSQLKVGLAKKFREDRAMYTESKADFIVETIEMAAEWREYYGTTDTHR